MSSIEKNVSPFITQQFPQFYRESGPNLIAFVKAYYEWLESDGGAILRSRSLLDYMDIDRTEQEFIEYFKKTYIDSIPQNIAADNRLLVKHILDLYRSKGSKRSYELLFRLLFNENIEIYIPGDYLLRPSDGNWVKQRYIETTSNPRLSEIIGKTISTVGSTAFAVVETVSRKIVGSRAVNVIYISSVRGTFNYGDRIICPGIIEEESSPVVIGSLTAIPIENGGSGFKVGDLLDVGGLGAEGRARVASVRDENGRVTFNLINGGSGFTLNSVVTVATTINLGIQSPTGTFSVNTSVKDAATDANGTIVFANSSLLTLINFSSNLSFTEGSTVTDGTSNAVISSIFGGGGTGASFQIGGLVDLEIYQINSDTITDYVSTALETQILIETGVQGGPFTPGEVVSSSGNASLLEVTYLTANTVQVGESLSNTTLGVTDLFVYSSDGSLILVTGTETELNNANLVAGAVLVSNTTSSAVSLFKPATKETVSGNGVVFLANSTTVTVNVSFGSAYFLPGAVLDNANTPTSNAVIISQTRLTDWAFPALTPAFLTNLDSSLNTALTIYDLEVGTIAFLSNINPGSGYSSNPYVDVIQPDVALLGEFDSNGRLKGNNAEIDPNVSIAQGVATAVEVYNSGFGYVPNETLFLTKPGSAVAIRGVSVVESDGTGEGSWLGRNGFISDIIKIQDSEYYQVYSYEIVAQRMMSTYESLVNDLIHPSGYKMFGRYRSTVDLVNEPSLLSNSSITQTIL
jgi:hypothetical protein